MSKEKSIYAVEMDLSDDIPKIKKVGSGELEKKPTFETDWGFEFDLKKVKEEKQEKSILRGNLNFIVVDIETTGISPEDCRMTEIVALRYTNTWKYLNCVYHNLLNPWQPIPDKISKITKISNEMVKYKPFSADGIIEFAKRIEFGKDILIAHNAKFERDWFVHNCAAFKFANWICTRGIYLYMRDGNTYQNNYTKNYSRLKQVCEYYGIEYIEEDAHRAEYDVLKTVEVARKMIAKIGILKCLTVSQAYVAGKGYGPRKQRANTLEIPKFEKGGIYGF